MKKYLTASTVSCASIIALALFAYAGVVHNGYVWDDRYFLVDYTWIGNIPDAFKASLEPLFGQRSYVRPLALFTLYLEAILSGRNPAVSHAINLLIHIASALLVYLLARRAWYESGRGRAGWVPGVVAAFFAVHPALTENVVWISSRFDLLATFFALCALAVAGSGVRDWIKVPAVGLLFLLAALCKESVAVLPAVLGVMVLLRTAALEGRSRVRLPDAFRRDYLRLYAALVVGGFLYLLVRRYVLSGAQLITYEPSSFEQHLVWMGVSVFEYTKLTLVPFVGNSPHHSFVWNDAMGFGDYWWQVVLGFLPLVVALGLVAVRRREGWWLLAWLVSYLPVLHLVTLTIGGNIVHQRFMYLPTAALLALAPYVLADLRVSDAGKRAALLISGALILLSVVVCRTIVPAWKDDTTLWKWTVAMDPGSVEARENLIWVYLEAGMLDDANKELDFIKAHGMRTTANVAVNMGVAYYRLGDFDKADFYYQVALGARDTMPKDQQARLLSNMAINYAVQGQFADAGKHLSDSLVLDPMNTMALGHMMAYCGEQALRVGRYSGPELERAREHGRIAKEVVEQFQPGAINAGRLCPPPELRKAAGL